MSELEVKLAEAYKQGFADCYAKQVIAAMKGEGATPEWCAVEGCQNPPTLFDMATAEFVCRDHLDYPDAPPVVPLVADRAERETE